MSRQRPLHIIVSLICLLTVSLPLYNLLTVQQVSRKIQQNDRTCTEGFIWNKTEEMCLPKNPVQEEKKKEAKTEDAFYLYLTFDDGPNDGTPRILDVLKNLDVRATFFIVGRHLERFPKQAEVNRKTLVRLAKEGHCIGDHSYDHMSHNAENAHRGAYRGVKDDIRWFGEMNIAAVNSSLTNAGVDRDDINNVIRSMRTIIRLPYTDNWRVGDIYSDCICTEPDSSTRNAIDLSDALKKNGAKVFGWDVEWTMSSDNRYVFGPYDMVSKLNPEGGRRYRKLVILSHDRIHRPGGDRDYAEDLSTFIRVALKRGYQFRTLDTYLTDKP